MKMNLLLVLVAIGLQLASSQIPDQCLLPAQTGKCRAFFPSFYYDADLGICDCFTYTGCGGNNNRFETMQECVSSCGVQRNLQSVSEKCKVLFKNSPTLDQLLSSYSSNTPDIRNENIQPEIVNEVQQPATSAASKPFFPAPAKHYIPNFFKAATHSWQRG
ncbi:UNVERIFIED_CONTAM: hypothetical protein GTU68_057011 [Idotea baltica]|nr:hypothetical protein [Idotea baltica]